MLRRVFVTLLVIAIAPPLSAQRLEQTRVAAHRMDTPLFYGGAVFARDTVNAEPAKGALMGFSGILFGTIGAFAGGLLAYSMETSGCSSDLSCSFGGIILGALIGEAIALPIGVHVASEKRHPLSGKIGRSLAVTAFGIGAAFVTQGYGIYLIPPLQLAFTMSPELGSGRAAAR